MSVRTSFVAVSIVSVICALSAGAALAQHVWLDEKGVKQYSDMPPPVSVPQSRILKAPANVAKRQAIAPATEPEANKDLVAAPDPAKKAPMTTAERNADFLKRKAEQEEKDKKAGQEAKLAAEKARNCERAREYQRILDSGQRIGTTESNGERSIMSDERRKQETEETRKVLGDCK